MDCSLVRKASRSTPTVLIPDRLKPKLIMSDREGVYLQMNTKARKSSHPMGYRDYIPAESAVVTSKNRAELWSRLPGDARVYCFNSVAPSTMNQYKVGVTHFLKFCSLFGTNQLLTTKPIEWDDNPHLHCYTFMETVVMAFLAYLRSDVEVAPKSAINYLSAVRKFWINCNMSVRELDTSIVIANERAGMVRLWRAIDGNKEADHLTLPFSVDMISYMFEVLFPCYRIGPLLENAICVATMTGYSIVARQCEYLYTPAAKVHHHLTAKEGVQFTVLIDGSSRLINAAQVGPFNLDQVIMCYITVRDTKNDAEGAGNRFPFQKLDLEFVDTEAAFCLCTEMFLLAKRAQLKSTSSMFSSPADRENWALTAEVLNYHMRRFASEGFGMVFIPTRYLLDLFVLEQHQHWLMRKYQITLFKRLVDGNH